MSRVRSAELWQRNADSCRSNMLMISKTAGRSYERRVVATVLGTWLVTACGGGSTATSNPTIDPKLSVIEQKVFQPSCTFSSCHGADAPQQGLTLAGSTYHVLVNQPSSEVPTRMLVAPSDPSGSYLLEKLSNDHPTSGARMPYLSNPLPDGEITAVRQWIEQGAQED